MPWSAPNGEDRAQPFPGFAFHVQFTPRGGSGGGGAAPAGGGFAAFDGAPPEVTGGFSEITGLEASMEAKVIKAGGRNYGAIQRAGPVSFATVVLKRGIIQSRHLWNWWSLFAGADTAANGGWAATSRCDVVIALISGRQAVVGWKLENAMPVKFRVGDLNARGTDVAIEELHLVHEGLHMRGAV
ncbi:MAG: phage tail protein [Acetobacteraceae bacterium]